MRHEPGDQLGHHAPIDHRVEPVLARDAQQIARCGIRRRRGAAQQHLEAARRCAGGEPRERLHVEHERLAAQRGVHPIELGGGSGRRHPRGVGGRGFVLDDDAAVVTAAATHRVERLADLRERILERSERESGLAALPVERARFHDHGDDARERAARGTRRQQQRGALRIDRHGEVVGRDAQHEGIERFVQIARDVRAVALARAPEQLAARVVDGELEEALGRQRLDQPRKERRRLDRDVRIAPGAGQGRRRQLHGRYAAAAAHAVP